MSDCDLIQVDNDDGTELENVEIIEVKFDADGIIGGEDFDDDSFEIANIRIDEDTDDVDVGLLSNVAEDNRNNQETEVCSDDVLSSGNELNSAENENQENMENKGTANKVVRRPATKRKPDEKSTTCKICGNLFLTRNTYLRHLLHFHSGFPEIPNGATKTPIRTRARRQKTVSKATAELHSLLNFHNRNTANLFTATSVARNTNESAKEVAQRVLHNYCNSVLPDPIIEKNALTKTTENIRTGPTVRNSMAVKTTENVRTGPTARNSVAVKSTENVTETGRDYVATCTSVLPGPTAQIKVATPPVVTQTSLPIHPVSVATNVTESPASKPHKAIPATPIPVRYVARKTVENAKVAEPKVEEENTITMCDACGKTFRFRSSYHKHVRFHHSEGTPPPRPKRAHRMCHFCGKLCSSGSFQGHIKKHTNPESVTCQLCGMVFSFESVLKSHMKVRHSMERPFQCTQCESRFKRADYLRSHMRYKHEPKLLKAEENTFRCEHCDLCFKNKDSYEKHCANKSETDSQSKCATTTFRCDECETLFKKRNYLILHKRYVHEKKKPYCISETSEGPYKCDKCGRRFASVCGRNYHCKSTHGTTFSTVFLETCDHCGLTFRNRVFYAKHCAKLRDKPTCYLCWNAFENDALLKEHMHEVHVDDLPFFCAKCDRRFVTLRQLTDHTRSRHANIRPFKCDQCAHASVRKDSLEVHIRSCHLNVKPYGCDLCDKKFSQKSDLRKHRATHTRNKLVKKEKLLFIANTQR